ncbi:hypothetical protein [Exiguobacterium sp. S90]|uniref:hypothetical protein n=1 Tax=Exiguobacterium sp. S90 TaxID=1221231 RepID=UPI001BEB151D|nr:hypothetical protein [Exiguobacterium sp. S90]
MNKKNLKKIRGQLNKFIFNISLPIQQQYMSVKQTVEKAIIPIYHIPLNKKVPIQIATGVLVKIRNEYFLFSASHVFDDIGEKAILTSSGPGIGSKIIELAGERYSSPKGPDGTHLNDPIDASVYHIKTKLPKTLKKLAIGENHLLRNNDFQLYNHHPFYIAAGFRAKKSNTANNIVKSKAEGFLFLEAKEESYQKHKLDNINHICLSYPDQFLVDGESKISPTPKGFSGGGIIGFVSASKDIPLSQVSKMCQQKLIAITIEQRRGDKLNEGILIGTKIEIFMYLVDMCFLDLLDVSRKN